MFDENFYAHLEMEELGEQKAQREAEAKVANALDPNHHYQQSVLDRDEREVERAEEYLVPSEGF